MRKTRPVIYAKIVVFWYFVDKRQVAKSVKKGAKASEFEEEPESEESDFEEEEEEEESPEFYEWESSSDESESEEGSEEEFKPEKNNKRKKTVDKNPPKQPTKKAKK